MASGDWLDEMRRILGADIRMRAYTAEQWRELKPILDEGPYLAGMQIDGTVWLTADPQLLECLEIRRPEPLSVTELNLIGLLISKRNNDRSGQSIAIGAEKQALALGAWIMEQLDRPVADMLPEDLVIGGRLYADMIPFLLIREYNGLIEEPYSELEKLLRSFFAEEIVLVPLQRNEWLILSPLSPLSDSRMDGADEDESEEDSLMSIGLGLHEMLASEWLGECHLAVSFPIQPSKTIVESTALLRETVQLGRRFRHGSNVHLPWQLHLERLLSTIPEPDRARFVEQAFSRSDYYVEPEIMTTLETFFSLDCNVSETAKKLYIHRNTLLYRLDKLKQETGLDVRQFRDAVMVKVILLLYKVTKRT